MPLDWSRHIAAVYRPTRSALKPVTAIDPIRLDDLVGIDRQKEKLVHNTEAFLSGKRAHHVLLRGSRGTGKSSLIKALLNTYAEQGLRIIEFHKEDLHHLPDVVDTIRDQPWRFLLYLDDLTFREGEASYTYLKSVMEGSIESPPENLRIYATTNRRHLIPEYQSENRATTIRDGEIHYADAVEEKISLSDRFGLWLSFYSGSEADYLRIVDHYFADRPGIDREQLHRDARRFAAERASRSGRTAWQFWRTYEEG